MTKQKIVSLWNRGNKNDYEADVDEAAMLLGLSPKTLAQWRWRGEGPPYIKRFKRVFYNIESLKRWAFKHCEEHDPNLRKKHKNRKEPIEVEDDAYGFDVPDE